jgi:hypothetical protein
VQLPIPPGCWLRPRVEVRRSTIEGLGLFAQEPLGEGEVVERLGGRLIDDAALSALTPPYSSLTVDDGRHLLIDPASPLRHGNHSCDPNLWHVDATTIVTRRAVAAGDELTIDYATHTGVERWEMACRCGAAQCRGLVTGADWRRPELQTAYGDHWTPTLLRRIAASALPPLPARRPLC